MAVSFTKGDSLESTRKITTTHSRPVEPHAKSHTLHGNNTMSGMPGYIDAHPSERMDGARGGPGVGPKREGPIGKRGSSGAKLMGKAHRAEGSMTKSYRANSTGKPGPIKSNLRDGAKHVHTGRMERLKGHVRTSYEGRKKSVMY